jgi:type I restriction enzyme S subunit
MKPTDALPHPPDWKVATVGRDIEIRRGISWSKEQEHSEARDGCLPVIRIGNVQDRLELDDLLYISELKAAAIAKTRVTAGWSVMVGSNGNRGRVGNAVLIREDSDYLFASFLLAARPKQSSTLTSEYFYRWLSSEPIQAYLSASAEGSTGLNNLSHSFFRAMTIPIPPEDEQLAIARILDVVDNAIDKTHEAIQRAIELKRALVQRLLSKGIRGEELKKTLVGLVPQSWSVVPLSTLVEEFQYGLSVPMHLKGDMPILRMGNIQAGDVTLDALKFINLPEKVLAPYIVSQGDVLFNRTNSQEHVGKVGIYRNAEPAVFASYLIRLKVDAQRADRYFLGQLLNSYAIQCRIKRYATPGVQQVNINATNLGKVFVPVPLGDRGLDEQRQIAKLLEEADAATRAYLPILRGQQQLKRSLMHDLLTGKVRANNLNLREVA